MKSRNRYVTGRIYKQRKKPHTWKTGHGYYICVGRTVVACFYSYEALCKKLQYFSTNINIQIKKTREGVEHIAGQKRGLCQRKTTYLGRLKPGEFIL